MQVAPGLRSLPLLQRPLTVAFWVVVLVATLQLVALARQALFIGFVGVLLAMLFAYPTRLLSRLMPRGLAVILTLVLFCGVLVGVGFVAIPTLSRQTQQLVGQVPKAADQLGRWLSQLEASGRLGTLTSDGALTDTLKERATSVAGGILTRTIPAALGVVELVSGFVLVLILAAFLAHRPASYAAGLRALVPRRHEAVFDELWRRLGAGLRHWLGGTLLGMLLMGSFAAIGTWAVGLEGWPMLGMLTFLGTAVPYLGAIASAIPGLILGLAIDPAHLLYALLVYVGVHVVEGYIVQPFLMRRAVEIQPAFLLLGQLLMGTLFGVPGIVIATPLLVCGKVVGGYLYVERRLGKEGAQA